MRQKDLPKKARHFRCRQTWGSEGLVMSRPEPRCLCSISGLWSDPTSSQRTRYLWVRFLVHGDPGMQYSR
jgi:hypothetical protein